jgi:peptidoglycan/xylan/chitin deacetylase (PgdA/CDA1 family)
MCRYCLTRRTLLAVSPILPLLPVRPERPIEPLRRLANVPSDRLVVALTFDACPGAFDQRVADALVADGIPATIFVTKLWLQRNPGGLAFLLAHPDLFALENHGELHIPPVLGRGTIFGIPVAGDLPTIDHEITAGATAITAVTGATPHWYRAATGYYTPSVIPYIEQLGVGIGGYSLNADAGASLPAHSVAQRIAAAANGDIIVAHINQPTRPSGEGVVAGIKALQRRSATFVRFDKLLSNDVATS